MKPLISIVIPVYCVDEDLLKECFDSIISQTFHCFEVIIIDDGSTDNCGSICDLYGESKEYIRVIHQSNQGVSAARNVGLANAIGDWVYFIDADDWLEEDACEILHNAINKYSNCDVIQFGAKINYISHSNPLVTAMKPDVVYSCDDMENEVFLFRNAMQPSHFRRDSVCLSTAYYVWDKIFKRDFLQNNNILFPNNIKISEDKVFYLNNLLVAKKIVYISNTLYNHRILEKSTTRKYSCDLDRTRLAVFDLLRPIAIKMDKILFERYHISNNIIESDLNDFILVTSSVVIDNMFYHDNYPKKGMERWLAANSFMQSIEIKKALKNVNLKNLTFKNAVRICALKMRLFKLLTIMNRILRAH